jgi:hypothetical protein
MLGGGEGGGLGGGGEGEAAHERHSIAESASMEPSPA